MSPLISGRIIRLTMAATILVFAALMSAGVGAARSSARQESGPTGCSTDTTLCLQDGRFLVEATWTKSDGSSGSGHPQNLSSDSGYFWFLEPDNVELVVKALNGCSTNGHAWLFAGGLTNLEVALTVTDTSTGEVKSYSNPQGMAFLPITDTTAFGCPAGAEALFAGSPEEPSEGDFAAISSLSASDSAPGCVDGDATLCIRGRFLVEASWQTAAGKTGPAHAVSLTSESGYFWFFAPSNVELLVKTLDACGIGKGQWFFAAGLTTVAVELKVTDTFTGEVRTYANPLGTSFLPIQDTSAFAFCPTPTPTPTITPTWTPTPTPTRTAPRTLTPTPTAVPNLVTVESSGVFLPNTITVHLGDTVNWVWARGASSLSTTSGTCSFCGICFVGKHEFPKKQCSGSGAWASGAHSFPFHFSHRFDLTGTFPYFGGSPGVCACLPPVGTVIVVP